MRYCRFLLNDEAHYGVIEDRNSEPWIVRSLEASAHSFAPLRLSEAQLLPPVEPTKIVCVGRNYRDHAAELGNDIPKEPLLFLKPPSSLLAPNGIVRMPRVAERVDYEGELAIVIARRASKIHPGIHPGEDWRSYIRGYVLANDVTARDLQKKDGQWTRAKGFDTFCPAGPWVSDEIEPHEGVEIETRVNGEVRQHGSTRDFIFSIPQLLEYITAAITLEPGDLILTGTPAGVGPVKPGDTVEVSVSGLGTLANTFEPE